MDLGGGVVLVIVVGIDVGAFVVKVLASCEAGSRAGWCCRKSVRRAVQRLVSSV